MHHICLAVAAAANVASAARRWTAVRDRRSDSENRLQPNILSVMLLIFAVSDLYALPRIDLAINDAFPKLSIRGLKFFRE
jgi:hypothetical protein